MFLTVVTSSKSGALASGLTYETDTTVAPGSAVRVPLRKRLIEGIVIDVIETKLQTEFDLKSINAVLGDRPLLTESQMKTVRWMSDYYCCSLRNALQVFLPPPPWATLLPKETVVMRMRSSTTVRGKKAQAVADFLSGKNWMPREHIMRETGASAAVLKRLVTTGALEEERRQSATSPVSIPTVTNSASLSSAQQEAYEGIASEARPSLLFGITGSGKTEVYAALIADTVRKGKQAVLLVPEILLTEHIIDRFVELLPRQSIAILHSRLTPGQRKAEWKRIHAGEVALVIGSRSALFAPTPNLGLVILDEEHEWTYKNEQTPRYHARETAEALCGFAGAKLVLGSATPSLESWHRAKTGRYHLARLPERYGSAELPSVKIVDLAETEFGKHYPFSPQLIAAIEQRLQNREQCVLFLNRRGAASALLCMSCRRRVISPESQLPFTVHHDASGKPYLMDHSAGLRAPVPAACPHCRSTELREVGAGTQRIEAILKTLFPKARLLRADADTLEKPEQIRALLRKMKNNEADILLGTQSVVKGLDLPNVTLAAVLIADIGLSLPHFRAGERILQLLTQLTGRSGRAKPGDVIIQTFRPDAPEVLAASKHETERYMEDELKLRTHAGYPPAVGMIRLIARGPAAEPTARRAHLSAMNANSEAGTGCKLTVGPTLFGGGREWHLLLRGTRVRELLEALAKRDMVVDIDPLETI